MEQKKKKKESREIRSLTRLFFCKIFKFMSWSEEQISEQQDLYYTAMIDDSFSHIIALLNEKSDSELTGKDGFYKYWQRFKKASKLPDRADRLLKAQAFLEARADGTIREFTKNEVIQYYEHEWAAECDALQKGLSVASIKQLKNYGMPKDIDVDKKAMIVDSVILPYFKKSEEERSGEFKRFKDTFSSVDYFLLYEDIKFALYDEAVEQLKDSIEELKQLEFDPQRFKKVLLNLFSIFDSLCAKNETRLKIDFLETSKNITEQQKSFINEIKLFLEDEISIAPDTCGMEQAEIDEKYMAASFKALKDMMFIINKGITWEQCKVHAGFRALIRYYLSLEMMKVSNNDFTELVIDTLEKKSLEESQTYIGRSVEISEPLWIGNHCYLDNCRFEPEVIIEDNVKIDASGAHGWGKLVIDAGSLIKKGIVFAASIENDSDVSYTVSNEINRLNKGDANE